MKRFLMLAVVALFAASCATGPSREQDLVNRALDAMGGADALGKVKTIAVSGTIKQWEPEQSFAPGGESRFANEAAFTATGDFAARSIRVDYVRNFQYPAPRTFKFSEIVTPSAGYVVGQDTNNLNKQAREAKSPAHSMSGFRLATTQRELRRASPSLLLEMRNNPGQVSSAGDITVGGTTFPSVNYRAGSFTYVVLFDPKTGLPARIRTLDYDNVWGDVDYDLVLSDWRTMGGVRIAASQKLELSGRVVQEIRITDVRTNVPIAPGTFEAPADVRAGAATPATGFVPYQWVIRRQFIGTYMDSDSVSFDVRATSSLRLNELAPGVQHVVGGTHNSLIVEMSDYLVVFDAPVTDGQSNWTMKAAQEKYPGKPVKYVVMTHHHMDHSGGIRAYAAQGATIVVGKGAGDHYRKVLAAPYTRNPDLASRDLSRTAIVEVEERYVLSDGKREVSAYITENPHSAAYLIGYVSDARIAFVTDIWSPGVPLPPKMNPALASVVSTVKKAGIQPVTFAGGHGSTAPYALLVGLAGGQ